MVSFKKQSTEYLTPSRANLITNVEVASVGTRGNRNEREERADSINQLEQIYCYWIEMQ